MRAGGNPSWNTGVNYEKQLENSIDLAEVKALYSQAGLEPRRRPGQARLRTPISADANAVST